MTNFFQKKGVPGPDSEFEKREIEVKEMMSEWYDESRDNEKETFAAKKSGWRQVFFIFLFFVIIAGFGGATIYWVIEGKPLPFATQSENITDQLEVSMSADKTVDSGGAVSFVINYRNAGRSRLIELDASLVYPDNFVFENSLPVLPDNFDKNHWRLPSLDSGASAKLEIHGQIFGISQEVKSVQAAFLYKPTNFHTFLKQKSAVSIIINKSVLEISMDAPDNLLPSQDVSYAINVKNVSESPVDAVRVLIEYPEELKIAGELKDVRNNEWNIASLGAGETASLLIQGHFAAKPAGLKKFRAGVGIVRDGRFVLQNQEAHTAGVIDPLVTVSIDSAVSQEGQTHFGETFNGVVQIANMSTLNLDSALVELRVYDPGGAVLWDKITVDEGFSVAVVAEGVFLGENERLLRINGLKTVVPSDEQIINFHIPIDDSVKNLTAPDFALELTPAISAKSSDLSVPLEVVGNKYRLEIVKK